MNTAIKISTVSKTMFRLKEIFWWGCNFEYSPVIDFRDFNFRAFRVTVDPLTRWRFSSNYGSDTSSELKLKKNMIVRKFCHLVDTKIKKPISTQFVKHAVLWEKWATKDGGNFNGCNVHSIVDQKWLVCVNKPFVVRLKKLYSLMFLHEKWLYYW